MLKMKKRGVSPLIATVILVGLSVALGALVMNFTEISLYNAKDSADRNIESSFTCNFDLSIKVLDINNVEQACYNRSGQNNFEVVLENQGTGDVEGMRFTLFDYDSRIMQQDVMTALSAHGRTRYNLDIEFVGDGVPFTVPPSKVIIVPIVTSSKGMIMCNNNRIELDDISLCE